MSKMAEDIFKEYQEFIISHPNYEGLYEGEGWIRTTNSKEGIRRKKWAVQKAKELNIPYTEGKMFRDIMFYLHPTKQKPCLICGRVLSLEYKYLSANMVKSLDKNFNLKTDDLTTIEEALEELLMEFEEREIRKYLVKRFEILDEDEEINDLLLKCIEVCENGKKKHLGPGVFSNFPDRLDGFHTYNKCCRATKDKGRHKENMRTYNQDRRAYEYISDGNIRAADLYMKHDIFKGQSADHIGPISLGFIHDPSNLTPLNTGENSAKRNRLFESDILEIYKRENEYTRSLISWYNEKIWSKYKQSKDFSNLRGLEQALREGCSNFLTILHTLYSINKDSILIINKLIVEPKLEYYKYNYEFVDDKKYIMKERKETANTIKEQQTIKRRILETIDEYGAKTNRRKKIKLDESVIEDLKDLRVADDNLKEEFEKIIYAEQDKIILKYQI